MRIYKVKIVLFTLITTLLSGCSISKNLTSNEKILKKNNLYINDILTPKDSLNNLFLQKKNSTFIGIPVGALLYSTAKNNTDSIFNNWLSKKNKAKSLNKVFSQKQVNQLKGYYKNFNDFKIKTNELNVNYADIDYLVTTGPQYYIGEVNTLIDSNALDSIYKKNVNKSFLVKNELFKTKNFQLERERLFKLFKNSGIYDFQINSVFFDVEIDSSNNIFSLPIKIIIEGKDYKVHKIKKVSVTSYDEKKLDFNRDFINNQIKFKENSAFNDSLRTITIQNFNKLDLFNFPSISYNYFNGSDELLEANIILNSKKKYNLGFGFDVKQSNIEDIGISFESRLKNRNIFKNGENLELSATGSIGKSGNVTISLKS